MSRSPLIYSVGVGIPPNFTKSTPYCYVPVRSTQRPSGSLELRQIDTVLLCSSAEHTAAEWIHRTSPNRHRTAMFQCGAHSGRVDPLNFAKSTPYCYVPVRSTQRPSGSLELRQIDTVLLCSSAEHTATGWIPRTSPNRHRTAMFQCGAHSGRVDPLNIAKSTPYCYVPVRSTQRPSGSTELRQIDTALLCSSAEHTAAEWIP